MRKNFFKEYDRIKVDYDGNIELLKDMSDSDHEVAGDEGNQNLKAETEELRQQMKTALNAGHAAQLAWYHDTHQD